MYVLRVTVRLNKFKNLHALQYISKDNFIMKLYTKI